ncbi:MAG: arylamine N-acetyltransferase [Ilumatobacteraceae bacterium]
MGSLSTRDEELRDAYLRRLGLEAELPSVDALFRLHRAQVERVPYETTWIPLGEQWTVDTDAAFERIAERGRGGYCFHLNGSLGKLLTMLGYDVSRHVGGVHVGDPGEGDMTNHLVLTVAGLPSGDNPRGEWYVDAGLGDALYEPLPLRVGTYRQDPFVFELSETPGGIGDWHFMHDPDGSFLGMGFRSATASVDEFADMHRHLSTSPTSGFVRVVIAERRDATGITWLRALTRGQRDRSGVTTSFVTDRDDWFGVLADEFFLRFEDVDAAAKDRLWASAQKAHEEFLAAQ